MHRFLFIVLATLSTALFIAKGYALQSTDELAEEARKKLQEKNQQAIETLRQTKARARLQGQSKTQNTKTATFQMVKTRYPNWKADSTYHSHQDYQIVMDYANEEHTVKLQGIFQQWRSQGWLIVKSDTSELKDKPASVKQLTFRIAKRR